MRFLLRLVINAVAFYAAITVVNNTIGGINLQSDSWLAFFWMALIFGLVNALLRPLITILTCPLILLTLGLFTLIINTFLFYVVGWIGTFFGVGYTVESFWSALFGSIIVSIVSIVLSMLIRDEPRERRRPPRPRRD